MNKLQLTIPQLDIPKRYLGKLDGEKVWLASPSWDCGWYWGYGYIQNRHLHTHFNVLDANDNLFNAIQKRFDSTFSLQGNKLWVFCELMQTFYTLKKVAELYNRGGSHYTSNPLADIIINHEEVKRINESILPKLFIEIDKLFDK